MAALEARLMEDLKSAMKAQDKIRLETVRAIRAAVLVAKSEPGASGDLTEEQEIQLLQRLKKQRLESATIYREQNRPDLAEPEEAQLKVIEGYLPAQLEGDALHEAVRAVLTAQGFSSPGDLGKAIGACRTALAGQVDGKVLADAVKALLTS
jgi:uncharacterized protein YqeY